jgi:hypothetical protein
MDMEEKQWTHRPEGPPKTAAEVVGSPAPLPILLRVPWLPPEDPPVVAVAPPRHYPLVVKNVPASAPPEPRLHRRRRWGWLAAAIILKTVLAAAVGWWAWQRPAGEYLVPAESDPEAGIEILPPLQPAGLPEGPAAPAGGARLAPEIIPLDAGETP